MKPNVHNETIVKDNLHIDCFPQDPDLATQTKVHASNQLCMHKVEVNHMVPIT